MKKTDIHPQNPLRILVLFIGVVFFGFFPSPADADMLQKTGFALKKNIGPQIMLDQSLFNVNIPLNVSNMPGPWKTAKLKAMVVVVFMDAAGETVGYGLGKGGQEFMPLDVVLDNGGYNGTVVFPIEVTMGAMTGKTCCVTMVLAELGKQLMFIGASTGGTAPNSGNCGNWSLSGISPGTILY
jgi:hypothetical protein